MAVFWPLITKGVASLKEAERIILARNGGEIIASVFTICKEWGMPPPNRGHLAGLVKRWGKTPEKRRRIWIALCEAFAEHIDQLESGGIGGVTQYMEKVIAGSGVAPAAREQTNELSKAQFEAVEFLVTLDVPSADAMILVCSFPPGLTVETLVQECMKKRGALS